MPTYIDDDFFNSLRRDPPREATTVVFLFDSKLPLDSKLDSKLLLKLLPVPFFTDEPPFVALEEGSLETVASLLVSDALRLGIYIDDDLLKSGRSGRRALRGAAFCVFFSDSKFPLFSSVLSVPVVSIVLIVAWELIDFSVF